MLRPFRACPECAMCAVTRPLDLWGDGGKRTPQEVGGDDSLQDPLAVNIKKGLWRLVTGDAVCVLKVIVVMCAVPAERQCEREGLPEATRPSHSLLIVEALRRDVGHHRGTQGSDV